MAKLLVDGGADVNVRDDNGVAPLAVATACGHMDVLKVLLDHPDIDVDTQVHVHVSIYTLGGGCFSKTHPSEKLWIY